MPSSTFDRVVQLLNDAVVTEDPKKKANNLLQVQELIIHKERSLLDNFLEEVLAFQTDRNADVRKTVVNFIEESCKHDYEVLPKAVQRLAFLIDDESTNVLKRVISCMMTVYRLSLTWAVRTKGTNQEALSVFKQVFHFKEKLLKFLHGPNDGVRMLILKFIESIIIIQSRRHPESEIPKAREGDISLDQISARASGAVRVEQLEAESDRLIDDLVAYLGGDQISSVNLQTLMGALANIAKQRPQFMDRAVQGFEMIHVNLPPNLAPAQVSSVRKTLKNQLLNVLRHPASYEYQAQITTLLTDLGASQTEVLKAMPKVEDQSRKRRLDAGQTSAAEEMAGSSGVLAQGSSGPGEGSEAKRMYRGEGGGIGASPLGGSTGGAEPKKLSSTAGGDKTPFISLGDSLAARSSHSGKIGLGIDQMANDLMPKLTTANVTDLVLLSMVMLPSEMPSSFRATYTPIAAAGTEAQMRHLARLLAAQLNAAGLSAPSAPKREEPAPADFEAKTPLRTPRHISTVTSSYDNDSGDAFKMPQLPKTGVPSSNDSSSMVSSLLQHAGQLQADILTGSQQKRVGRAFSLERVTERLSRDVMVDLGRESYVRLLASMYGNQHLLPIVAQTRARILTSLPASFGEELYALLCDYCIADLKTRFELLSQLVYTEYTRWKGLQLGNTTITDSLSTAQNYDAVFTQLLTRLAATGVKETYFRRLLIEAPLISESALSLFKWYCGQPETATHGFDALLELLSSRVHMRPELLLLLLDFTGHESGEVRQPALQASRQLYNTIDDSDQGYTYRAEIEKFSKLKLKNLLRPRPPPEISQFTGANILLEWSEDLCRPCLFLFLFLLPDNHKFLFTLAKVYVKAVPMIKRSVLRMIDQPIRQIGMRSPEVLHLIENCPKGAETLLTRIIHILTDKHAPTVELVDKVKDLYNRRSADVRFLIPVLKGLSRTELIAALPKLIQLNEKIVKEVFNRLLVAPESDRQSSPISPEDLLVAVHLLEFHKDESGKSLVDLKAILRASQLCFAERRAFTQEKLSIVIGHLLDQSALPTLFMRTVMQSLAMYPRLIGYVVNVLATLIRKQVWKNPALWEGFIRCCVKMRPQSYQVLLQLPPERLQVVFEKEPELRSHVRRYVDNFSSSQRSHISRAIISVLETPTRPAPAPATDQTTIGVDPSVQPVLSEQHVATADEVNAKLMAAERERIAEDKRKKREKLRQMMEQDRDKLTFLPKNPASVATQPPPSDKTIATVMAHVETATCDTERTETMDIQPTTKAN